MKALVDVEHGSSDAGAEGAREERRRRADLVRAQWLARGEFRTAYSTIVATSPIAEAAREAPHGAPAGIGR